MNDWYDFYSYECNELMQSLWKKLEVKKSCVFQASKWIKITCSFMFKTSFSLSATYFDNLDKVQNDKF